MHLPPPPATPPLATCTPDQVRRMNRENAGVACVLPDPPFPRCKAKVVAPCWRRAATAAYVVTGPGASYRWTGEVR